MSFGLTMAGIASALGMGGTAAGAAGTLGTAAGAAGTLGTAAGTAGTLGGLGTAAGAGGSLIPAGLGSTGALTAKGLLGSYVPAAAGGGNVLSGGIVGSGAGGGFGGGVTGLGGMSNLPEAVFGTSPNLGGSGAMFNPTAAPSSLVQGGEIMGYSTAPSTPIPGGYDAAGRAALDPSNVGPVQEAGMFSEGFQPGAYEMGAGDSVNKFTPAGMSNLQKAYIGSQIYSATKPKEQPVSYPSMSMPGVTAGRAAPQMAPRRPLPMGGFMGAGYKPRLGSRRY